MAYLSHFLFEKRWRLYFQLVSSDPPVCGRGTQSIRLVKVVLRRHLASGISDDTQGELTLADRTLSTYINALARAGFVIEQMIEENDDDRLYLDAGTSDLAKRAKMFPVTFAIKARKL